jgi:hypothetical protein
MKNSEEKATQVVEKGFYHDQKKHGPVKSPDIHKLQEVIIDNRTKIYIALDASPEEARSRYLSRLEAKGKAMFASRKPTTTAATATTTATTAE